MGRTNSVRGRVAATTLVVGALCWSLGAAGGLAAAAGGPALASSPDPRLLSAAAEDAVTMVNFYRSLAGLPSVARNASWSDGDWKHARYMVKNNVVTHSETPGNPWYTPEGALAATTSNINGSSDRGTTDREAVESWMQGPFHAIGILDPALAQIGYGAYAEERSGLDWAAALDVIRGLRTVPPEVRFPVRWPGPGARVPLTSHVGESPSPLTSCSGYRAPAGLPIIVQYAAPPVVTGHSVRRDGNGLEHCVFTGASYANPNGELQRLGRSILSSRNAVVLIPRSPLVWNETYTVSLTVNGSTSMWSFTATTEPPDCTIHGTAGNDVLTGTPGDDVICSGDGDDSIRGLGGNDWILGGAGRDRVLFDRTTTGVTVRLAHGLATGEGFDRLSDVEDVTGSPYADTIKGSAAANALSGNGGNDSMYGYGGNDGLFGNEGADTLDGGYGADYLHGGDTGDTISGSHGADTLVGFGGDDQLFGGPNADHLTGGANDDSLDGGTGTDTCRQDTGSGPRTSCEA